MLSNCKIFCFRFNLKAHGLFEYLKILFFKSADFLALSLMYYLVSVTAGGIIFLVNKIHSLQWFYIQLMDSWLWYYVFFYKKSASFRCFPLLCLFVSLPNYHTNLLAQSASKKCAVGGIYSYS